MNRIFIVTGASGFVGGQIAKDLIERGETVRVIARSKESAARLPATAEIYSGNILAPESIDKLFDNPENADIYVIHAAAYISVAKKDEKAYITNVEGTRNIIRACREHNVKRLVYIGSVDALYNPRDGKIISEPEKFHLSKPDSDYARSKCEASAMVMAAARSGLDAIVVMPSAVTGPGDRRGFVSFMLQTYIKGIPPFSISGGYDFVDVRDLSAGILDALEKAPKGEAYILSGEYISVTDVFDTMAEYLGRKKTIATFPAGVLYPAAPFANIYFKKKLGKPLLTGNAIGLLKAGTTFSHEKAVKAFGYKVRPIKKTIIDTVDFLMESK